MNQAADETQVCMVNYIVVNYVDIITYLCQWIDAILVYLY